ncbi:hypothetical protein [Pseudomonas solani]|uniref:hypothetical protein n=1 Tax=Pseudomonas solani TaxID=2731552 RepID=UPI003D6C6B57
MNAPLRNALPHLLCLLLLCACLAEARERQHAGGFVTGRGQAGSWQTQRSGNLADGLTRQRSVTGNDGRSASTSSTTRYDRDSGQFSRNSTTADGRGLSLEGTRTSGQNNGTWATTDGRSGSFSQQSQRGDDGLTRQTQVTNAAGETAQRSASYSFDRDSDTLSRSVTGNQGETRTGSLTLTPNP